MQTGQWILAGLTGALAAAASAQEENFQRIDVRIALDRQVYFRGQSDPVHDLIVTMMIVNTEETTEERTTKDIERVTWVPDGVDTEGVEKKRKVVETYTIERVLVKEGLIAHFAAPRMGGEDTVAFEIFKLGQATGEKKEGDVAEAEAGVRRQLFRSPPLVPTGRISFPKNVTLQPQESKEFRLDAGKYHNISDAGVYEITAIFESVRSNTVKFEVLPVKRVAVRKDQLLRDIRTYERGLPKYAYMFYICPTGERWDEMFYLIRRGKGADERFVQKDLCKLRRGTFPQVATAGRENGHRQIAFLVEDKSDAGLYFLYVVDFDRKPIHVARRSYRSQPGAEPPRLVAEGATFRVEGIQGDRDRSTNQPE